VTRRGVERWDARRDGPLSEARLRAKLEARGYRVTHYVYVPGTYFPPHTHDVDKIDAVLSGRLRLSRAGASVELQPGDAVAVPRGVVHDAAVVGHEPVISLDAMRRARPSRDRAHPQERPQPAGRVARLF
jgi:quercetin dioxygenase-like cupin family protein